MPKLKPPKELKELAKRVASIMASRPDLLKPEYQRMVEDGAHPLTGHCYVAAEALWHAGAKAEGFRPHVLRLPGGGTHWYLADHWGTILDPTRKQFTRVPAYAEGRCCGFLTREPSARAKSVLAELAGGWWARPPRELPTLDRIEQLATGLRGTTPVPVQDALSCDDLDEAGEVMKALLHLAIKGL